jgi:L-ascorbate metabolism protein UlaG (beta-lactamase superfamily)/rhodanese-related sulfurtransferase
MKKLTIMALLSLLGLCSCKGYQDLSVEAFQRKLATDGTVQLLDVRTPHEYAEGHIPGAINIDWLAEGFVEAAQATLDPERPVLTYCRRGRRSAEAASALVNLSYKVFNLKKGFNAWEEEGMPVTTYEVERFCTPDGDPVEIYLIKHASMAINYKGLSIQVDPVIKMGQRSTNYAEDFPEADYVLVTHEHGDHFDKEALGILGGTVVTNANCANLMSEARMKMPVKVLANGESLDLTEDIHVDAVPAYNYTEGHLQFHPKGRDNGFILNLGGTRIYIAGDTEDIPEMADIKDIDVAFLPCNQPYTMTVEQCINAAKIIQPKVLIPYHFGQTDISGIPEALPGMDVRLRQMQ